ncbi:MAG: Ni/Fe hydrogenase subunit alpha [Chloroflexi bacterium]|nr:Ni/Fe hydrogenase subunit alpha [Chloroflexota bacterium]
MPTLTIPLSRIEGHAQVRIHFHGGDVQAAHFQATELRGFEHFVQGAPAEQMPVITPRICGVCSTAHHIAAVKALEAIFGVVPPPRAVQIRELMMLGQLIQNQATSLFMFTMPDLPGQEGLPSLFHLEGADADLAPKALQIRRAGTDLITTAGGQFIHPVRATIGGVSSEIDPQAAERMVAQLRAALPVALELFERYWELFLGLKERIGTLGDDTPTYYLAAVSPGHAYYGERIRVLAPSGAEEAAFDPCDHARFLTEQLTDTSYSSGTLFKGEVLRANSLARLNMLPHLGTPLADQCMERFRREWGHPAHAILLFDLARGIELIYGLEEAIERLSAPPAPGDLRVSYTPRDGEGCGLVEAPRGPLIHHYAVEKGLIRSARFVIPTQHNILAIERALLVAARRYISKQGISAELERAVGRVVRAFDPCIACATH